MSLLPEDFEEADCPFCGSSHRREIHPGTLPEGRTYDLSAFACTNIQYAEHPPIVSCRDCGFLFASPRLKESVLAKNYAQLEDPRYLLEAEGRRRTYARMWRGLQPMLPPGARILDVGCYAGVFLDVARARGVRAFGVDLCRWGLGVARAAGHPVLAGRIDRLPLAEASLDGVVLWDVIEHLREPRKALAQIRRLLRPGGAFALTTHDIGSVAARIMGPRYPFLMLMHTCHFSRESLRRMLEAEGFEGIRIEPHVRVLRLKYLVDHVEFLGAGLRRLFGATLDLLGLGEVFVPVRGAGLMTVFARRRIGS